MLESLALAPLALAIGLLYEGIDRKLAARMQNRVGPPILQPFYDIWKLIEKEHMRPEGTGIYFTVFPLLALCSVIVVVPLLFTLSFEGDILLILYMLAMSTAFLALSGFASLNPFGAVGGWREILQFIGYEFPFIVATLAVALQSNSLSIGYISTASHFLPFAFFAFLLAVQAKLSRPPFHIPEAETEIVAGIETEYSGTRLAALHLVKSVELFALISFAVLLFFGFGTIEWFALNSLAILFFLSLTKVLVGRLRIDQSVRFFWLFLGPLALIDLIRVVLL